MRKNCPSIEATTATLEQRVNAARLIGSMATAPSRLSQAAQGGQPQQQRQQQAPSIPPSASTSHAVPHQQPQQQRASQQQQQSGQAAHPQSRASASTDNNWRSAAPRPQQDDTAPCPSESQADIPIAQLLKRTEQTIKAQTATAIGELIR